MSLYRRIERITRGLCLGVLVGWGTAWGQERIDVDVWVDVQPRSTNWTSHLFLVGFETAREHADNRPIEVHDIGTWVAEWPHRFTIDLLPGLHYIAHSSTSNQPSGQDLTSESVELTVNTRTLRFRISGPEEIDDSPSPIPNWVDVLIETGRPIASDDTVFLVGYPAGDDLEQPRLTDTNPIQIDRLDFEIDGHLIMSEAQLSEGRVYVAAIGSEPAITGSVHSPPRRYSGESTLILRFESPNIEIAEITTPAPTETPIAAETSNRSHRRTWLLGLAVSSLSCLVGFWFLRRRGRHSPPS